MPDDQSLSVDLEQAIEAQKMEELQSEEQVQEQDAEIDPAHLRLIEALIFASAEPVSEAVMTERLPEGAPVKQLLAHLQEEYAPRGVNLFHVGSGWAFRTAAELGDKLKISREVSRKMSRAAVETLAIIAYHQPVTRAEIEEIRGVSLSKGTIDVLFETGWIRPRGRRRAPGRPVTWGTSTAFLDHFGIESLDDLPGIEELKAAGLLDKRPAIQTLGLDGAPPKDEDQLAEPAEDPEMMLEDPLDPGDEDMRKLIAEK